MTVDSLPGIKPGQWYRHYKGDTYVISDVAFDPERGEALVLYTQVGFKLFARTLGNFFSLAPKGADQTYRFELCEKQ